VKGTTLLVDRKPLLGKKLLFGERWKYGRGAF